ncbi:hypothetical protein NQ315_008405 [Exocentrus adspersus]|uniref:Charged multivesicular body protein 7 n=1 Tax=Exocentrus adspersus TaxID=1586481 RepID=A0AAV8W608_9CUCU|nr:hypothetical protein NQ315_008405 [Exocentrus adspersus]
MKGLRSIQMFGIPAESLPDVLKDETRLNVLFAPLRSRTVNPKDWEYKISCWKNIIRTYCDTNDIYTITLSSLNNAFVRNGRPPSCLREVITEMAKEGDVQIMEVFLKNNPSNWSGWATEILIKRPLSWSYNKLRTTIFSETEKNYVHLEVINSKCEKLMSLVSSKNYKNKLINLQEVLTLLGKTSVDIDNVKLLLHNLTNQHLVDTVVLNQDQNKQLETVLIKFGDGAKVMPISEIDVGIYTLEKNEKLILKNIEELEEEIQTCVREAKMNLLKNHRQMAKSALRKKHELEKRVEKKANALHNIQILLEQIHETHTDAHVWESYKNALSAFNTTFKDTGLSEDAVEDTMIKLGDVLDIHNDIQTALARPVVGETDDLDLEEELTELLKDDEKKPPPDDTGITTDLEHQLEKLTLNLPNIPDASPNVSVQELSLNN